MCHVPFGSVTNMTAAIENQVERFAPGFKETILAKHAMNTAQLEEYNPNYLGGDINGGVIDIGQLFLPGRRCGGRLVKLPRKCVYICSSSNAARRRGSARHVQVSCG